MKRSPPTIDPSSSSWSSDELLHLRHHGIHRLLRGGGGGGHSGIPAGKSGRRLLPGGPKSPLVAHRHQPHRLQHLYRTIGWAGGSGSRFRIGRGSLRVDVRHHPDHCSPVVPAGIPGQSGHHHARIPGTSVRCPVPKLVGHLHDPGLHLRGHGHGPLFRGLGPGDHVRPAPLVGLVAVVVSRKEKDSADYFLAGRNLPWWLIGISLIASNISTEQLVGQAGQGMDFGLAVAAAANAARASASFFWS